MSVATLTPGAVARQLFGIDPDRDERASQLCVEALLTLVQNGYRAPAQPEHLRTPKRQQFAVRSLALGRNFLEGREEGRIGAEELSPQRFGELLAAGEELLGSANLALARDALQGLIDPSAHRGQPGGWLLRPFHESLLWFDARRDRYRPWTVRQVYMRGSGITLARMLCDPPVEAGREAGEMGAIAVERIREALQADSPLGHIAQTLEAGLPPDGRESEPPEPERDAWRRGGEPQLAALAARVCRHAEGVMAQGTASAPAKLWQLRTILALDLASHALAVAQERLAVPQDSRHLLLSFGGPPRRDNRVRQLSELSYADARQRLRQATVGTLADGMRRLHAQGATDWEDELVNRRGRLDDVVDQLEALGSDPEDEEFERLARLATDTADYGRAAEGFRVLLETVGLLAGTGAYRYLSASPELLSALVGALSARMPMTSSEFFEACQQEWGMVIGQSTGTRLAVEVDGAELARNARRAEALLGDAGLAVGLSDRTMIVGERAARREDPA